MKKFRLPRCPYCGKKINPLYSWYLKNQGEFLCPKCGGISNIILDPAVYILGSAAVIVSLIGFLVTRIGGNVFNLTVFLWLVLPYFVFSVLCCFLVRLKKPVLRKKPLESPAARQYGKAVKKGKTGQAMPPAPPVQRVQDSRQLYREGYTTQFKGPLPYENGTNGYNGQPEIIQPVSHDSVQFSPPERRQP